MQDIERQQRGLLARVCQISCAWWAYAWHGGRQWDCMSVGGVLTLVVAFTAAPAPSSSVNISSRPVLAAQKRGLQPFCTKRNDGVRLPCLMGASWGSSSSSSCCCPYYMVLSTKCCGIKYVATSHACLCIAFTCLHTVATDLEVMHLPRLTGGRNRQRGWLRVVGGCRWVILFITCQSKKIHSGHKCQSGINLLCTQSVRHVRFTHSVVGTSVMSCFCPTYSRPAHTQVA
jgi:hypothetical protein